MRENLQTWGKNKAPKLQTHLSPAAGRPGPGFLRVRGRGSYGPSPFSQLVPTPKSNPTHGSSARTFRLFLSNPGLGLRGQFPPRREVGAGPVLSSCPRRGLQLALGAPLQSPGPLWHSRRGAQAGLPGWPRAPPGWAGVGERLPAERRVGARHLQSCRHRCVSWRRRRIHRTLSATS